MNSTPKVLGLVFVTCLAFSIIDAAAALAWPGRVVSDGPMTLHGQETGLQSYNRISTFGVDTRCPGTTYTGHKWASTPHALLPSSSDLITVTPHYINCTSSGFPSTIDMNGCDFQYWLGETVGTEEYSVAPSIVCPEKKHIEITAFENATKHFEGKPFCVFTITENAGGYFWFRARDTTNGYIDVNGTWENITADRKSPTGSILCMESTTTQATLSQDLTVSGTNGAGGATAIALTDF